MKIIKSILILLFIIPLIVGCSQQNVVSNNSNSTVTPDFRNIIWGMSQSEVKTAEKEAVFDFEMDNSLNYQTKIDNTEYSLVYLFVDDKLYAANYIRIGVVNDDSYIHEYEKIKKIMSEKYGNPSEDNIIWKDELFKNDPNYYGIAVAMGHVVNFAKWDTPNTIIGMMLDGVNSQSTIVIGYTSKEYKPLVKESIKEEL